MHIRNRLEFSQNLSEMNTYKEDILGNGFEQLTIDLPPDYEGAVKATLVRRRTAVQSRSAILYIHGFNDYFFQEEMALRFNEEGFNFYALDLRKYGRSYMPHQKFNDIRSLHDYFPEILEGLNRIKQEGNNRIILLGHSTGGLIVTLFASHYTDQNLFDGVVLNSPFFDFNLPQIAKIFMPTVATIGKYLPSLKIAGGFSEEYGKSLHVSEYGNWDYLLSWKPHIPPKINLGWIRAIHKGHQELNNMDYIPQPILVLCSRQTVSDFKSKKQMQSMDAVLNVNDIQKKTKKLRANVTLTTIKGGMHDLILSSKDVREQVYSLVFNWLLRD